MQLFAIFFGIIGAFFITPSSAHDPKHSTPSHEMLIQLAALNNRVEIREDSHYIYIQSNGIPNHQTGAFPNKGNPNRISEQRQSFKLPKNPQMTGNTTESRLFGIALNGVLFEPGTAECYGQRRGGPNGGMAGGDMMAGNRPPPPPGGQFGGNRPPPPPGGMLGGAQGNFGGPPPMDDPQQCDWREEAIVNNQGQLGLDFNNAHVQPTGLYHYHGIPTGFIETLGSEDTLLIGYAADGFKIYYNRLNQYQSGYKLKQGNRPSGANNPGGRFDGSYTADYEFIASANNLDECNGTLINGEYAYLLTNSFPYVPRCWKGTADPSFQKRRR